MSSALLHPLVAACMAFAPAAPASEPAPAAEPAADAEPTDAAPSEAEPSDDEPTDAEPDTEPTDPTDAPGPDAEDGAPADDETAAATEPTATEPTEPEPVEPVAAETAIEEPSAPAPRERPETVSAPPPRATVIGPPSDGRRDDIVSKALLGGGIGSLGLGLGLAGVSAWFWVERSQADRNIEALEPGAAQTEAQDQRKQFGTLATVTAVAGSVYVVTGAALLLLHARDRKRVSATPTVGAVNGVVVQGRF